jgi:hypothetical protein
VCDISVDPEGINLKLGIGFIVDHGRVQLLLHTHLNTLTYIIFRQIAILEYNNNKMLEQSQIYFPHYTFSQKGKLILIRISLSVFGRGFTYFRAPLYILPQGTGQLIHVVDLDLCFFKVTESQN